MDWLSLILSGLGAGAGWMANQNREGGEQKFLFADKPAWFNQMGATNANAYEELMRTGRDPMLDKYAEVERRIQLKNLMDQEFGNGLDVGNYNRLLASRTSQGLPTGGASNRITGNYLGQVSDRERAIDDLINKYTIQGTMQMENQRFGNAMQFGQVDNQYQTPKASWTTPYAQNGWDSMASLFNGAAGITGNNYQQQPQPAQPAQINQQTYNGSYISGLGSNWQPDTTSMDYFQNAVYSDPRNAVAGGTTPYLQSQYGAITPQGQGAQWANQMTQYAQQPGYDPNNIGPRARKYLSSEILYRKNNGAGGGY